MGQRLTSHLAQKAAVSRVLRACVGTVLGSALSARSFSLGVPRRSSQFVACVAAAFAFTVAATSCGEPLDGSSKDVERIVLTPTSASVQTGATVTLEALVLDASGNAMRNRKVIWASEDATIATVSQSGVVTGVTSGNVNVAASSGGKSASSAITVTARPVSIVLVTPGSGSIPVTGSITLRAEALDATGAPVLGRPVAWTSSNESVAVVGSGGVVAGIAVGSVTITATIDGRTGTALIAVVPQAVASVTISPNADTIVVGRRVTFRATPLDANGLPLTLTGRSVTWVSSDPVVATVSSAGEVVGQAAGSAKIRASIDGISAEASIVVNPISVASVTIAPANPTLSVGQTLGMTAIVRDAAGNILSGRAVSWTAPANGIVTVDSDGTVTAVASGSETITATSEGVTGTTVISVSAIPVARVLVTPTTASLSPGMTAQLTATAFDANNNVLVRSVTWASSNNAVASASAAGLVTGIAPGTATISATSGGVTGTALVSVAAIPVASVSVTPSAPNMFPHDVLQLTATARDASGNVISGRVATWVSSNTAVATVSATGVVTAVAQSPAAATITATIDNVSGSATVTINQIPVASVTLAPAGASLYQGQQRGFIATARDAAGNALSRPVTWATTSPATIINVTQSGVVTALNPGTAGVVATAVGAGVGGSNVGDTASVTVSLVPVASMTLSPQPLSMFARQQQQLSLQLFDSVGGPLNQSGRSISWVSRDPAIASVNSSGQVTGVAAGNTRVVVSTPGATAVVFDSVTVAVQTAPILSVTVQPKPQTVFIGQSGSLRAVVVDALGIVRGRNVAWQSRSPGIVTVSQVASTPDSAVLTAVSLGSTYVQASDASGFRDSSLVTVQLVPVASVTVAPGTATINLTNTTQLAATAKDAGGNVLSRTITWVSLAPSIASVNATGLVTANAGGSATIQARANGAGVGGADVVGTAAITVNVPVQSVTVSSPRSFVVASDTMHLTVVLRDALNNVITGRPITFSSSAPGSVAVNGAGVVTGAAPGNATITATSQGQSGTLLVRSIAGISAMSAVGPANNVAQDTLLGRTQTKTYTVTVAAGGSPVVGVTIAIGNSNSAAMSISASSMTTNGSGQGTVNVTAGASPGAATITFTATRAGSIPPGSPGNNTQSVSIRIVVP
jgi:uncharacterized protein YjdB